MRKAKLYYANIDLTSDIEPILFKTTEDAAYYAVSKIINKRNKIHKNIVYLIAHKDEIFVSDKIRVLTRYVYDNITDYLRFGGKNIDLFLQEYPTFEEAYAVALSMREGNKLCYNDDNLDSPYWPCAKSEYLKGMLDNIKTNLDEK